MPGEQKEKQRPSELGRGGTIEHFREGRINRDEKKGCRIKDANGHIEQEKELQNWDEPRSDSHARTRQIVFLAVSFPIRNWGAGRVRLNTLGPSGYRVCMGAFLLEWTNAREIHSKVQYSSSRSRQARTQEMNTVTYVLNRID